MGPGDTFARALADSAEVQGLGPSGGTVGVATPLTQSRSWSWAAAAQNAVEPAGLALLAVATLAVRILFRGIYLFNWDAVQFALGVQRFDLVAHRPHPPGYLGYIALGRLFEALSPGHPGDALVLLSAVAEAAAVVLAYAVARAAWGRFAGWSAAVLTATSPLLWIYGGAGLTYALEPALAILVLWGALEGGRGRPRALLLAAIVTAVAGAIRPTDELFLAAPLILGAWRAWQRGQRRAVVLAACAAAAASAAWVLPLVWASGGLATYLRASAELSARASNTSAVWVAGLTGAYRNGDAVVGGLATALGLVVPLAAAALVLCVTRVRREFGLLVAALLAPTLAVYVLVHIGQLGYLLLLLPALLLPAGLALDGLARAVSRRHWQATRAGMLVACAVANVAIFALPPGGMRDQVVHHDAFVGGLLSTVRRYDPATTLLVTSAEADGSYRDAQYYLGGYPLVAVGRDRTGQAGEIFASGGETAWRGGVPEYDLARFQGAGAVAVPGGIRTVLVLDPGALDLVGDRARATAVHFGDGWKLWRVRVDPGSGPVGSAGFIYLRPADCPCNGAGHTRAVPVPGQPL